MIDTTFRQRKPNQGADPLPDEAAASFNVARRIVRPAAAGRSPPSRHELVECTSQSRDVQRAVVGLKR